MNIESTQHVFPNQNIIILMSMKRVIDDLSLITASLISFIILYKNRLRKVTFNLILSKKKKKGDINVSLDR